MKTNGEPAAMVLTEALIDFGKEDGSKYKGAYLRVA